MINLKNIYGNKIFDRKASYRNARYIPFIANILIDLILAGLIINVFNVNWDYAFLKVYLILLLFGVLKYIFTSIVDAINYRVTMKNVMTDEMNHYLTVFNSNVDWDEIGTYDDFLLEAAFNETQSTNLRVLAAINYGVLVDSMSSNPYFEGRLYKLFCKIVPNHIGRG